jgi:hypothetical protein
VDSSTEVAELSERDGELGAKAVVVVGHLPVGRFQGSNDGLA